MYLETASVDLSDELNVGVNRERNQDCQVLDLRSKVCWLGWQWMEDKRVSLSTFRWYNLEISGKFRAQRRGMGLEIWVITIVLAASWCELDLQRKRKGQGAEYFLKNSSTVFRVGVSKKIGKKKKVT